MSWRKTLSNFAFTDNGVDFTRMYKDMHNEFPNLKMYRNLDGEDLFLNLWKQYNVPPENVLRIENIESAGEKTNSGSMLLLDHKVMVQTIAEDYVLTRSGASRLRVLYSIDTPTEYMKKLEQFVRKYSRIKASERTLELITTRGGSLDTQSFNLKELELDLGLHYNDDFLPIHEQIMHGLELKGTKGLVLLHGSPGTGKTTYIRYLIGSLKKKMIYLPPDLTHMLSHPEFMNFVTDHSGSILIIEDAENALMDRQGQGNDAVSNLLNLSDGLLADCLNLKIICTFNQPLNRIDKALLRKGRLLGRYEFKLLSVDKARALATHLELGKEISTPMTLADLYNLKDPDNQLPLPSPVIGFRPREEYEMPF